MTDPKINVNVNVLIIFSQYHFKIINAGIYTYKYNSHVFEVSDALTFYATE